ncbi:NERD domain-containing protein [Peribacillus loiseleuriae]|uniref:NERD domain-containing protein n=1 Tax=Peribacillus loiseleuriae TaxID=1679170 RepID=UPI00380B26BC
MFIKPLTTPLALRKLQVLLERTPIDHPARSQIQNDLGRVTAGFKGEESLLYYLEFLNEQQYFIFHNLRLPIRQDKFFQLDYLILSATFFLILEVKNFSGIIHFDPHFNQIIRTNPSQEEETFPDPLLQAERQVFNLHHFFQSKKVSRVPLETLIIFPNSYTQLKTTTSNNHISKKEIQRISNVLLKAHTPLNQDISVKYSIQKSDLIKGIQCPLCTSFSLVRSHGIWMCPSCGSTSRNARQTSIRDYALLIKPSITNRELREFILLESRTIATKLLKEFKFPTTGLKKGQAYIIQLNVDGELLS